MRILLVDDDVNKVEALLHFITVTFAEHELEVRKSFQSGLREIIINPPSLLLLDMTMPTYDVGRREPGGRERRYAGKEVLRQMARRNVEVPVIVITQYEQFEEEGQEVTLAELTAALKAEFPFFIGAVYYQAGDTGWMDELRRQMDAYAGETE